MSMKCQTSNNKSEKTFPFFNLPYDIRYIGIKKMDVATKLFYFISSDVASMDMPKNYITSIQIYTDSVKIRTKEDKTTYSTIMLQSMYSGCEIRIIRNEKILETVETGSDVVSKIFQRLLRKSWNLKTLIINMKDFPFKKLSIKNMKNLRFVTINMEQHGLMDCGFANYEQLYQVRDVLNMTFIKLELHQLIQFNAQYVTFGRTIISTDVVNQYLKSFINGEVLGKIKELVMHIDSSSLLDVDRVYEGLNTLGLVVNDTNTTFALVSNATAYRVALVEISQKYMKIEFFSEKECRERASLFSKYGDLVKTYVQSR